MSYLMMLGFTLIVVGGIVWGAAGAEEGRDAFIVGVCMVVFGFGGQMLQKKKKKREENQRIGDEGGEEEDVYASYGRGPEEQALSELKGLPDDPDVWQAHLGLDDPNAGFATLMKERRRAAKASVGTPRLLTRGSSTRRRDERSAAISEIKKRKRREAALAKMVARYSDDGV